MFTTTVILTRIVLIDTHLTDFNTFERREKY